MEGMKRKLVLLVGTFLILLLAFGTYRFFTPGAVPMQFTQTRSLPQFVGFPEAGEIGEGVGRGVEFVDRNADGQLRGVYKVASWSKRDDGSFHLLQPQAVVYQKDGRRTYLSADEGFVWAEEVGQSFNVRHGKMAGNVEIYFDQSRDIDRIHPRERSYAKRQQEVIEIKVDYVDFDNDVLEITTDSAVRLWSKTVDLMGKGLLIQWNESPRELRRLRIASGDVMIIKELTEEIDMLQIPVEAAPAAGEAEQARLCRSRWGRMVASVDAETPEGSESQPPSETGGQESSEPSTNADTQDEGSVKIEASETSEGPIVEIPRADPTVRNVYEARFDSNVRVYSGDRELEGADYLALRFEWDRAWRPGEEGAQDDAEEDGEPTPAGDAAETTSSAASADDDVSAGPETAGDAMDTQGQRMTEAPSEADAAGDADRMLIYWDGPLEILPKDTTPNPSRKRYRISGKGRRVVLSDSQAAVICSEFQFENPQQEARFRGTEDAPARLLLTRGEEILCNEEIRFNRQAGRAYLTGPGMITRYAVAETLTRETLLAGVEAQRQPLDRIEWDDHVEASFGERMTRDAEDQPVSRPFLKDAEFFGNVEMRRFAEADDARNAPDDFVQCARLHVFMTTDEQGRAIPQRADATGSVKAHQQGSNIEADKVVVYFDALEEGAAAEESEAIAGGLSGGRVRARRLQAQGGVRIRHRELDQPDEPATNVQADDVDADLLGGTAVLVGKPALIWQGSNRISGPTIRFEETLESARIDGEGELQFKTTQDLSGNTLSQQRYVYVAWRERMRFDGQKDVASFTGGVKLRSGGDSMQCDDMHLRFVKVDEPSAPAGDEDRSDVAVRMEQYSSRKIASIQAIGGYEPQEDKPETQLAVMQSRSQHEKNPVWLERRMELRGQRVDYDALTGESWVTGWGQFFAEDYRPPENRNRGNAAALGDVERPSQTVFEWRKGMYLNQAKQYVQLQEKVVMVHYSGDKVLRPEGLKAIPAEDVSGGRVSRLRCDRLEGWFEQAPQTEQDRASGQNLLDAGPQIGALRRIIALGDVSLQDGPVTIDAQQLLYNGVERMVTVLGFLPGADRRTNARIVRTDSSSGRVQPFESPKLTWDMETDRIEVGRITGGGGL